MIDRFTKVEADIHSGLRDIALQSLLLASDALSDGAGEEDALRRLQFRQAIRAIRLDHGVIQGDFELVRDLYDDKSDEVLFQTFDRIRHLLDQLRGILRAAAVDVLAQGDPGWNDPMTRISRVFEDRIAEPDVEQALYWLARAVDVEKARQVVEAMIGMEPDDEADL